MYLFCLAVQYDSRAVKNLADKLFVYKQSAVTAEAQS